MAHAKSGGSTSLGRDSRSQRLGVKRSQGERVFPGMVIVRQRGSRIHPGQFVFRGGDDTLYAQGHGVIRFRQRKSKNFHGKLERRTFVDIVPA